VEFAKPDETYQDLINRLLDIAATTAKAKLQSTNNSNNNEEQAAETTQNPN
jgi:hypothetical protein